MKKLNTTLFGLILLCSSVFVHNLSFAQTDIPTADKTLVDGGSLDASFEGILAIEGSATLENGVCVTGTLVFDLITGDASLSVVDGGVASLSGVSDMYVYLETLSNVALLDSALASTLGTYNMSVYYYEDIALASSVGGVATYTISDTGTLELSSIASVFSTTLSDLHYATENPISVKSSYYLTDANISSSDYTITKYYFDTDSGIYTDVDLIVNVENIGSTTDNTTKYYYWAYNYTIGVFELKAGDSTSYDFYVTSVNTSDYIGLYSANTVTIDSTTVHVGGALYYGQDINNLIANFIGNFIYDGTNSARGGALYNNDSITNLTGNFIGNYIDDAADNSSAYGGAIYNTSLASITNLTGNFIANYVNDVATEGVAQGGAIYNGGTIDTIIGDFISNYVYSTQNGHGGAIYNEGTISTITGDFIGNSATGQGGAIANAGKITTITGDFIDNSGSYGGAINNNGTTAEIETIMGDFIGNSTTNYGGGAIFNTNSAKIGTIIGDFISNEAAGNGGAIINQATIEKIEGNFISNSSGNQGGAIYNSSTISSYIIGSFTGNEAGTYGGAIYNSGSINYINGSFTDNEAGSYGGAIYNSGEFASIELLANYDDNFYYTGNYAGTDSSSALASDDENGGFLYMNSGSITFNIGDKAEIIIGEEGVVGFDSIASNSANSASTSIEKTGTGTLTVNSSMKYYYGELNVSQGTMEYTNSDVIGSGTSQYLLSLEIGDGTSGNTASFISDAGVLSSISSIVVNSDGTLNLAGGTLSLGEGVSLSGDGTVLISEDVKSESSIATSTLTVAKDATLSISAGNLDAKDAEAIGTISLTDGTLENVNITGTGTLNIEGTVASTVSISTILTVEKGAKLSSSVANLETDSITTDGELSLTGADVSTALSNGLVIASGENGTGSLDIEGTTTGDLTVLANANGSGLSSVNVDAVDGSTDITGEYSVTSVILGDKSKQSGNVDITNAGNVDITNAGNVTLSSVSSTKVDTATSVDMTSAGSQSSVYIVDTATVYVGDALVATGSVTINGDSTSGDSTTDIYSSAMIAGDIKTTGNNADIDLDNIGTVGAVSTSGTGSDITIDNAKSVGAVNSSGDATLTSVENVVGDLVATSSTGIDVKTIGGKLDIGSTTGEVNVSSVSGLVDIDSVSDDVSIGYVGSTLTLGNVLSGVTIDVDYVDSKTIITGDTDSDATVNIGDLLGNESGDVSVTNAGIVTIKNTDDVVVENAGDVTTVDTDDVDITNADDVDITNAGVVSLTEVSSTKVDTATSVDMTSAGEQSSIYIVDTGTVYTGASGIESAGSITINGDSDDSYSRTNIYVSSADTTTGALSTTADNAYIDLDNIGKVGAVATIGANADITINNASTVTAISTTGESADITLTNVVTAESVSSASSVTLSGVGSITGTIGTTNDSIVGSSSNGIDVSGNVAGNLYISGDTTGDVLIGSISGNVDLASVSGDTKITGSNSTTVSLSSAGTTVSNVVEIDTATSVEITTANASVDIDNVSSTVKITTANASVDVNKAGSVDITKANAGVTLTDVDTVTILGDKSADNIVSFVDYDDSTTDNISISLTDISEIKGDLDVNSITLTNVGTLNDSLNALISGGISINTVNADIYVGAISSSLTLSDVASGVIIDVDYVKDGTNITGVDGSTASINIGDSSSATRSGNVTIENAGDIEVVNASDVKLTKVASTSVTSATSVDMTSAGEQSSITLDDVASLSSTSKISSTGAININQDSSITSTTATTIDAALSSDSSIKISNVDSITGDVNGVGLVSIAGVQNTSNENLTEIQNITVTGDNASLTLTNILSTKDLTSSGDVYLDNVNYVSNIYVDGSLSITGDTVVDGIITTLNIGFLDVVKVGGDFTVKGDVTDYIYISEELYDSITVGGDVVNALDSKSYAIYLGKMTANGTVFASIKVEGDVGTYYTNGDGNGDIEIVNADGGTLEVLGSVYGDINIGVYAGVSTTGIDEVNLSSVWGITTITGDADTIVTIGDTAITSGDVKVTTAASVILSNVSDVSLEGVSTVDITKAEDITLTDVSSISVDTATSVDMSSAGTSVSSVDIKNVSSNIAVGANGLESAGSITINTAANIYTTINGTTAGDIKTTADNATIDLDNIGTIGAVATEGDNAHITIDDLTEVGAISTTGASADISLTNVGTVSGDIVASDNLNLDTNSTTTLSGSISASSINVNTGSISFEDKASSTDLSIATNTNLTTNASNLDIDNAIENAGTLRLTGGTDTASDILTSEIIGTGTTEIAAKAYISADADLLGNEVENSGSLTLTGSTDLSVEISSASTNDSVVIAGDITIVNDGENTDGYIDATDLYIKASASLTTDAGNISASITVEVDGTITLTGGDLTSDINYDGSFTQEGKVIITGEVDASSASIGAYTLQIDASGELTIVEGGLSVYELINDGILNITHGELGSVNIINNAEMEVLLSALNGNDILNNEKGVITIIDTGTLESKITGTGDIIIGESNTVVSVRVEDTGSIEGSDLSISQYSTLTTNASSLDITNTISNEGALVLTGGELSSDLTNSGTVDTNASYLGSVSSIVNDGVISLTGTGTLSNGNITGSGTLDVAGTVKSEVEISSDLTVATSGTLSIDADYLTSTSIDNSGIISLIDTGTLTNGNITGSGTLDIAGTVKSEVIIASDLTVATTGTLSIDADYLTSTSIDNSGIISLIDTGTLSNGNITGSGTLDVAGTVKSEVEISSDLTVATSGTLSIDADYLTSTSIDNSGIISLIDTGTLTNGNITGSGTLDIAGTVKSEVEISSDLTVATSGTLSIDADYLKSTSIDNSGIIEISDGELKASITGTGDVTATDTTISESITATNVDFANTVSVDAEITATEIYLKNATVVVEDDGELFSSTTIHVDEDSTLITDASSLTHDYDVTVTVENYGTIELTGGELDVTINDADNLYGTVIVSGIVSVDDSHDGAIYAYTLEITEDGELTILETHLGIVELINDGILNITHGELDSDVYISNSSEMNIDVENVGANDIENSGEITIYGDADEEFSAKIYIDANAVDSNDTVIISTNEAGDYSNIILSEDAMINTSSLTIQEGNSLTGNVDTIEATEISNSGNLTLNQEDAEVLDYDSINNEDTGSLTIDASALGADKTITNEGSITFTGGTLDSEINTVDTASGSIVIDGDVSSNKDIYTIGFELTEDSSFEADYIYSNEYIFGDGSVITVDALTNTHVNHYEGITISVTGEATVVGDIISNSPYKLDSGKLTLEDGNIDTSGLGSVNYGYILITNNSTQVIKGGSIIAGYSNAESILGADAAKVESSVTVDAGSTLTFYNPTVYDSISSLDSAYSNVDAALFNDVGTITNNGTIDMTFDYTLSLGDFVFVADEITSINNGGISSLYSALDISYEDFVIYDYGTQDLILAYLPSDFFSNEADNENEENLSDALGELETSTGNYEDDLETSNLKLAIALDGLDAYMLHSYSYIAEVDTMLLSNMNFANVNRARSILEKSILTDTDVEPTQVESAEVSAIKYSKVAQLQSINLLGSKDASNGVPAYDYWSVGSTANLDVIFSETAMVGLSIGGAYNKVKGDEADNANSTAFLMNLYGVARTDVYPVEAFVNLGYAHFWNEGSKGSARGEWDSNALNALVGVAFRLDVENVEGLKLNPLAMLNIVILESQDATIKGNSVDMHIDAQNYISAKLMLGLEAQYSITKQFGATLRTMYSYELGDASYDFTYGIGNLISGVDYVGGEAGRSSAVLGLGLFYDFSENCSAYFDYNAYIYDALITHSLNLSLGIKF